MATRYVHTNLIAHDWLKLKAFYVRVFGCVPIEPTRDLRGDWLAKGTGVQNPHLVGQHLRLPGHGNDGPTLEIFQYDTVLDQSSPVANRAGFAHLAFQVDDVDAAREQVISAGGTSDTSVARATIAGAGLLTFTYVRDPEGNLIELQSWTGHDGA